MLSFVFDCLDLGFIVVTKLGCMQDDLDYHVDVTDSRLRVIYTSNSQNISRKILL